METNARHISFVYLLQFGSISPWQIVQLIMYLELALVYLLLKRQGVLNALLFWSYFEATERYCILCVKAQFRAPGKIHSSFRALLQGLIVFFLGMS